MKVTCETDTFVHVITVTCPINSDFPSEFFTQLKSMIQHDHYMYLNLLYKIVDGYFT